VIVVPALWESIVQRFVSASMNWRPRPSPASPVRSVDPDTGIDDGDGDLAGVVFDDEPDVAGGSWVGVADGVSDCFADSERDRGEHLAVAYPGSGKGIDGGVPWRGHRCGGRGPSLRLLGTT
jgi:hypothetical protein